MKEHVDVIVVGGGVIGCSIAYQLAKNGVKVMVLERNKIGSEASSAAAGILGAQAEIDEEGPLLEFALQSRSQFSELVEELKEETGIDVELIQKGVLKPARSQQEAVLLREKVKQHQRWDRDVTWLTQQEAVEQEERLSPFLAGAMYIPNDGQLNPAKLTEALALAASYHGAIINEYCDVRSLIYVENQIKGVITANQVIHSDKVIVTTGSWAKQLMGGLLPKCNVYPVKGECISVTTRKKVIECTIFLDEGFYLVPKTGGRIVIGATKIPHSFNKDVSVHGVMHLLQKAKEIVPSIGEAVFERHWAGLRPQTADGLPYLGKHEEYERLYMAFGHYRNGILLSAATGIFMADLIQGRPVSPYFLEAFRANRHHIHT
ncbi:glycine oxidase ThiO [Bacillus songklensis]|uniref:glycine oxidase n=1 Tax=Bacillus songklensis TaxID=1069116 RepID=A0ABV8B2C2_9BACI